MIVWSYLILKSLKSLKSWPFIFSSQGDTYWLVVSIPLKKYEFVSWDDDIPNWMEKKTCSKPATIYIYIYVYIYIYTYVYMQHGQNTYKSKPVFAMIIPSSFWISVGFPGHFHGLYGTGPGQVHWVHWAFRTPQGGMDDGSDKSKGFRAVGTVGTASPRPGARHQRWQAGKSPIYI